MTLTAGTAPVAKGDHRWVEVPFVDLAPQHRLIAGEVLAGIAEVVERGDLVLGTEVDAFEHEMAAHHGVAHAVGVGNGTDAIELALRAAGVGPGDEVIVPANTFVATAEAVERAGGQVVLVDCDDEHLLLDPSRVAEAVTSRTRAVVAVHLYGQAAPVEALGSLVSPGAAIVEDAAQAQGGRRHGRPVMSLGDLAATSFYPSKNLGAWGDAGAVLTSSDAFAQRVRALRNHGSTTKYEHTVVGTNSRLDTIQAVVLRVKLRHLDAWNRARRQAATLYRDLLADVPSVRLPSTAPGNDHVWHLYTVRVPAQRRDHVLDELHRAGVAAGVHYPVPVHLQRAFAHLGSGPGDHPVAEAAAAQLVSLPLYPGITEAQQRHVVRVLRAAVEGR